VSKKKIAQEIVTSVNFRNVNSFLSGERNMMIRLVVTTSILLALCCNVFATGLADKVQEYHLDNGATVLLVERHSSPTVSAYITFKVGSVNETNSQRGAAHLLEHMLFKGTQTLGTIDYAAEKPLLDKIETLGSKIDQFKNSATVDLQQLQQLKDQLKQLQQEHRSLVVKDEFSKIYAANGGVGYNAYTGKDSTTYLINLPANKLELWAAIETDRLENAVFREFYTERDVVYEERRRSYESRPDGLLYEALLATAYKVHPYREPTIGWRSDIENLSPADIKDLYYRYYTPANMVITLVGDFNSSAALTLIDRYFGRLRAGEPVPRVVDVEPPQNGERRVTAEFDAEPQLMIAYHKPAPPERDDYVFDLLTEVLSGGRTSRLYQALVVEQQLVSDIGVFTAPGSRYPNLLVIAATPRNGVSCDAVENAIYAQIEQLQQGISHEELSRARRQITMAQLRRMKSNSGLARTLSTYEVLGGWRYLLDYQSQIETIAADEIMAVAARYLVSENRTVAVLQRGERKQ
jgi:predicted Zn-dependent peptidase